MAEYIEREAVMQAFSDYVWNSNHSDLVPAPQWNHAVDIVRDYPAADVVPVRHGRWVVSRTDYSWNGAEYPTHCKCDQCGREVPYQDRDNYCPNCGAKMDGDANG